ncbi:hypothetical protein A2U01_0048986, partial [Trifolium medium]|nr:hypothetical protein [Trifolium medium]
YNPPSGGSCCSRRIAGHSTSSDQQILTERQSGKHPQNTQEIPVDWTRPIVSPSNPDLATILAALNKTNELLHQLNLRIEALERNQRPRPPNCPPRRHHRSRSPPRQEHVYQ